jgi:hypothetical protein
VGVSVGGVGRPAITQAVESPGSHCVLAVIVRVRIMPVPVHPVSPGVPDPQVVETAVTIQACRLQS